MPQFNFRPDQPPVADLLREIQRGDLQLPDFQRSWVWDDDRIRDLLASVSLGWPVGAVLLLECGGTVRFKARNVEGSPPSAGKERRLVLDGQQRLTSLYLALQSGAPVPTIDRKGDPIKRIYYFDIKKCIDAEVDRYDAILSLPPGRQLLSDFNRKVDLDLSTPDAEYRNFCIPVTTAFDGTGHKAWRRGFNEFHGHARETSELWDTFESQVVEALQSYRLPVIELSRDASREAVCMVFEKVNVGGKALDVFELVTATYAADEADLRDDWEQRRKRLTRHKILSDLTATEFLQAVTLTASYQRRVGEGRVGCKRTDVLDLPLQAYRTFAQPIEDAMLRAAQLLDRECVFESDFLPYQSQLIPLAAIGAVLGPRMLEEPARAKILRWYWCGVFGELYGGASETRFGKDIIDVLKWIDGGDDPTTIRDSNFAPPRLLSLRTRGSAAYKGFMALLLRTGARDFFQGDEIERSRYFDDKVDIHHIFPSDWCGKHDIAKQKSDSIVNKTPLTSRTNKRIGGVAPSTYLERVARAGVDVAAILESHLIDSDSIHRDAFDEFLRERARTLLDGVEAATGKPIAGRDSAEVVKTFGGDLSRREKPRAGSAALDKLFASYKVLDKLPSGGMSEGFRVRAEDGAVYFLKKVPVDGVPGDALRRELDIYARLHRADAMNVLKIHTFERSDEYLALVVEFADGGSLASHVCKMGQLSPTDTKRIVLEILGGLRELHSLDIVHRDLKPENVFLAGGRWKLGDFGISKSLTRLATQGRTFQGHGTPGFAPPEQFDGAEAHPSADIYSLGKLIAFAITNQTDVDQIVWPAWAQLARHCTERSADARPSLDDVETALNHIAA